VLFRREFLLLRDYTGRRLLTTRFFRKVSFAFHALAGVRRLTILDEAVPITGNSFREYRESVRRLPGVGR
jgi:hypothetical protein